jgi:hypothetical protein
VSIKTPLTAARHAGDIDFLDFEEGPMWRLSTAFGLSAVLGVLCAQQSFGAPQSSPKPVAVGSTADGESLVWLPPAEIAASARARQEATGSIDKQDGVAQRPSTTDAAAFEELRAEVSALRRAVDAIPAVVQQNRPPDYAPTLGGIAKAIQVVEKRLAGEARRAAARPSAPGAAAPHF